MKKFFKSKSSTGGNSASAASSSASPSENNPRASSSSSNMADYDKLQDQEDIDVGALIDEEEESQRAPSSYKSSLFSTNSTFDSFSTNPSSKPSSRQRMDKSRNNLLQGGSLGQIDEQAEMSSFFFQETQNDSNKVGGFLSDDIGRPLRVINADLYSEMSTSSAARSSSSQRRFSDNDQSVEIDETFEKLELNKNLQILNENLVELLDQLNDNSINISKATVSVIDLLEKFQFSKISVPISEIYPSLKQLMKFFLQFHDYYLRFKVYLNSKKLLIRKFIEFLRQLGLSFPFDSNGTIPYIQNFPIPLQDPSVPLSPNSTIAKVEKILNKILNSSSSIISDQPGAFIAPILRGLTDETSIISIMFGIPDPQPEHYELIDVMYQSFPDVHFFLAQDFIQLCNDTSSSASSSKTLKEEKLYKFKPPFKLPNYESPEISLSISSSTSSKSSGTLGCYLKPNIPSDTKDSGLLKYKGLKFVLTCAHVLLSEMTNAKNSELHYPLVQSPSKVLIESYKTALIEQRDKYSSDSIEFKSFDHEIFNCDNKYGLNLGQVIWGERILIHNKISDIAIVKLDNGQKVSNSFITSTENEQTLMKDSGTGGNSGNSTDLPLHLNFKNSKIVKMIPKSQFHNYSKVFKIGTSTNYTTGSINGIKMIYWLEGHLQSSEFVVSSGNMFANAGDSGSLILNDLNDQFGLGAIGMLHSFDGEAKQLGLFSTIEDIVGRLKDVTGVEWELV